MLFVFPLCDFERTWKGLLQDVEHTKLDIYVFIDYDYNFCKIICF